MMTSISLKDYANLLLLKAYAFRSELSALLALASGLFVILSLLELQVLMGLGVFTASVGATLYFRFKKIREKGIITLVSPKMQDVLLKRSIFDIYRDQVYYPYITKIIGVFLKGAVTKPHPQQLGQLFEGLPENVKKAVFTKGILHLAPEKLERLIIEKDVEVMDQLKEIPEVQTKIVEIVPEGYGKVDKQWDRLEKYEAEEVRVHENTLGKHLLETLNERIQWRHIVPLAALVSAALLNTKGRKLGRILLYNGSFCGIILLVALVLIKYKKPGSRRQLKIDNKQSSS